MKTTTATATACLLVLLSANLADAGCPDKCVCRAERNEHLDNQVVDCSHQGLTSIPTFDESTSVSTWKLNLKGNRFRSVPKFAFANLTDLKELDLSDCGITQLEEESFAGLLRLDRLNLRDNLLSSLPEHLFHRHSPALTDLDLAGNRLSLKNFVKAGKYLLNLQSLYLGRNGIGDDGIPKELGQLTRLENLDLSFNSLGHVDDNFFQPFGTLVQLEVLDLSFNGLRPTSMALNYLPLGLEELNLAGNPHLGLQDNLRNTLYGIPNDIDVRFLNLSSVGLVGSLEAKSFDFVTKLNLQSLDLSKNRLSVLNSTELSKKIPYLEELYLNDNRLNSVVGLGTMEKLRILDLGNNSLQFFPQEIFLMPELENLSLRHNKMKRLSVPRSAKQSLLQLKWLDLSRNKLSTILVDGNQHIWRQFPGLRSLDLSFNSLSNMDPMNMASLGELEILDIRHNQFAQIHNNLIALIRKLKSLQEVRINSNPFQCACRWITEAAAALPPSVNISGLTVTLCRSDALDAPTVAGFADATCGIRLPGTPKIKSEEEEEEEEEEENFEDSNPAASIKGGSSSGLTPGGTAVICIVVVFIVVASVVVVWKYGHRVRGRFIGGTLSYTEILDEYHPPNGGGVPL